jgi:hypothetical protein
LTRRRYSKTHIAPEGLFPELIEVLLHGWSAPWRLDDPDPFRIFLLSDAELRALWRNHRRELLVEWQRRGQTGPCFAEQAYEGKPGPYSRRERLPEDAA